MEKKYFVTQEGYDNLKKKLEHLINVDRQDASERIRIARGFGDLSENAEYDAAKDYQAQVEAEILTIQAQLDNAEIIENTEGKQDTVIAGCKVKIYDYSEDEESEYTIVGTTEASILEGKISNESPLAVAIMGKKVGAEAIVELGDNSYKVKVLKIN
ncbi:MAG: transcription elongation factor GreA [Clostridia bacterium]|nr:transcription elongation factor GreA [Clostridia bacterium]MDE6210476.1 transcription elongation factor GreA [Clostridia bacterium]MDE6605994.1 transcription elongation factor GreA [Clostridia bacterium]MDE6870447.1 transcription elongation factor GreA [Clostridia bacterium]